MTGAENVVKTAAQRVADFSSALDDLGIIGVLRDKLTAAATPAIVNVYLHEVALERYARSHASGN